MSQWANVAVGSGQGGVWLEGVWQGRYSIATVDRSNLSSFHPHLDARPTPAARSVLQTVIGVTYFGDLITTNRATSIIVILGGSLFYTWIKALEAPTAPLRQATDIESNGGDKVAEDDSQEIVWQAPEEKE